MNKFSDYLNCVNACGYSKLHQNQVTILICLPIGRRHIWRRSIQTDQLTCGVLQPLSHFLTKFTTSHSGSRNFWPCFGYTIAADKSVGVCREVHKGNRPTFYYISRSFYLKPLERHHRWYITESLFRLILSVMSSFCVHEVHVSELCLKLMLV